jgi:hypothetical protein
MYLDRRYRLVVSLLVGTIIAAPVPAYAWQYGANMAPTTQFYDSYEMPTTGMWNWNTVSPGNAITFWSSASNTGGGGGFSQNGIDANEGGGVCFGPPPPGKVQTCLGANTWGIFFQYCFVCRGAGSVYYGNAEWTTPPVNFNPTDKWYFSGATYPNKGEYSWFFADATNGLIYSDWVCNTQVNGQFTGTVGGISEREGPITGFGSVYINNIALWAQVQLTGQRNSGSVTVASAPNGDGVTQPPGADNITVIAANDANVGFTTTGSHPPPNSALWSGGFAASNEYFPYDQCP